MHQIQTPSSHNGKYWITNNLNQVIVISPHKVGIVQSINGKNTIDQIKEKTLSDLKEDKISANENNKKITDENKLKILADNLVDQTLEMLKVSNCFIG